MTFHTTRLNGIISRRSSQSTPFPIVLRLLTIQRDCGTCLGHRLILPGRQLLMFVTQSSRQGTRIRSNAYPEAPEAEITHSHTARLSLCGGMHASGIRVGCVQVLANVVSVCAMED